MESCQNAVIDYLSYAVMLCDHANNKACYGLSDGYSTSLN